MLRVAAVAALPVAVLSTVALPLPGASDDALSDGCLVAAGEQKDEQLDAAQLANARIITGVGTQLGLPTRAAVIPAPGSREGGSALVVMISTSRSPADTAVGSVTPGLADSMSEEDAARKAMLAGGAVSAVSSTRWPSASRGRTGVDGTPKLTP